MPQNLAPNTKFSIIDWFFEIYSIIPYVRKMTGAVCEHWLTLSLVRSLFTNICAVTPFPKSFEALGGIRYCLLYICIEVRPVIFHSIRVSLTNLYWVKGLPGVALLFQVG